MPTKRRLFRLQTGRRSLQSFVELGYSSGQEPFKMPAKRESTAIKVTLTTIQAKALTRWAGVDGRDTATKARDIIVAAIGEAQSRGEIPDAPKANQSADTLLRSTLQRLASGLDIDPMELAAIAHDADMDLATLEKIRTCLKGESNGHAVSKQS